MKTDIFGYMRFSYLGRSDVLLSRRNDDAEFRRNVLYTPERLEERFHFFEKLCLPSLRWQTDKDFHLVIFTSPELPDRYRNRLETAVADIPQIEIVYDTAAHVSQAINPWIERQESVHAGRTLHFRLDDDDALASDFIATLRQNIPNAPDHCIISRPSGLFLANSAAGPELLAKFDPYIAIGYALVNPAGHIRNPYSLAHTRYRRIAPSLILPGPLAYIHTTHLQSDTREMEAEKLMLARADHATSYYASRPHRFREMVQRQFNGLRPVDLLKIIASSPGRRAIQK